jgi:NMD protein affecting ribosome stability and mRNA decay
MTSLVFCSKCGKNEVEINEFTNKEGNTICKDCWLAEENNNDNKDNKT